MSDFKFKLPPSKNHTGNYDELRGKWGESIRQKSCTTCQHFRLEFGMYPQCVANKTSKRLDENEKLDSMPICGKIDSYYCKWRINPIFTVNHQIESSKELNEFKESDYYEVYEHFTGEVKQERVGWFSKKEVKVSFFYVLKNGAGYHCKGEWDHSINSYKNGFIPLNDHKDALNILVKYDSAEEAIAQCELFNSWGNKHGNLIYSTGDSLEAKFRELEKRRAKTTKPSTNPS